MAETRTRINALLLKPARKGRAEMLLELFDARDWPDEPEAGAGLYRLRLGGKWVNEAGRKYTFFTAQGLAALLSRELTAPGALLDLDAGHPDLRKGQRVRLYPQGNAKGWTMGCTISVAASDPIQCIDGQWRILLVGVGFVPCDEVQGLDIYGRETKPETAKAGA